VAAQLIREYIYLYGAVTPKDGTCVYRDHADIEHRMLSDLDGAPNHRSGQLVVPDNITLLCLPPYSPELNPKENLWDEIREKIFKNYALKSMDAVRQKLEEAILYIERNPCASANRGRLAVRSVMNSPSRYAGSTTGSSITMVTRPPGGTGKTSSQCRSHSSSGTTPGVSFPVADGK
jgi:transposase